MLDALVDLTSRSGAALIVVTPDHQVRSYLVRLVTCGMAGSRNLQKWVRDAGRPVGAAALAGLCASFCLAIGFGCSPARPT